MSKKTAKSIAQRRAKKAMKKRRRENVRHKGNTAAAATENVVQHQMLGEFGNVQNFLRNVLQLAEMMKTDPDLQSLRFDPDKVYAQFDLAADREQLADLYANAENIPAYAEEHEEYWHDKRHDILEEFVNDEFVERCEKVFKKLMVTKKGFKKEYRAALAGNLLVQSHSVAISRAEAPIEDNNLWELVLLATIKENPQELPEPVPEEAKEEAQATEEETQATEEKTQAVEEEQQEDVDTEDHVETEPTTEED